MRREAKKDGAFLSSKLLGTNEYPIIELLNYTAPFCDAVIIACRLPGDEIELADICCSKFDRFITGVGTCFTPNQAFNATQLVGNVLGGLSVMLKYDQHEWVPGLMNSRNEYKEFNIHSNNSNY